MDNNETMNYSAEDIKATKDLGILCYFNLLLLVPALVNKESPFTRFHVNQGLVLTIFTYIGGIIIAVARNILEHIPFIGYILSSLLGIVPLLFVVLAILGIVNVAQGQAKRLPVIGNIQILK